MLNYIKRLLVVALSLSTMSVWSAVITWSSANQCSASSDVVTAGELIFAYTGGTAATVNGVAFTSTLRGNFNNSMLRLEAMGDYTANAFTSVSAPFAALESAYRNILIAGVFNGGAASQVTLKRLQIGVEYTIQLWVNDPRAGVVATRYALIDDAEEPQLVYNSTGKAGGVGSWVVGTFVADAQTQSFELKGYGETQSTQINALQLRADIEVPNVTQLYWDTNDVAPGFGVAGGIWGYDQNWNSDAAGVSQPEVILDTTLAHALYLGTAELGLEAGTIQVSGTQGLHALTYGLASEPITLTGGTLSPAGLTTEICLNGQSNVIESSIEDNGNLAFRAIKPLFCDGFASGTERVIFKNARLSDYTAVEAQMAGNHISGGPIVGNIYFWDHQGDSLTFQVQIFNGDGNSMYTKAIKLQLKQVGADITARVLYAKYFNEKGVNHLGYDFDSGGSTGNIASWFNQGGYGVTNIKLLPYDHNHQEKRFSNFLTTAWQIVASNTALASVCGLEGYLAGGWVNDRVTPSYTFYWQNDGQTAKAQFQHPPEDNYIKCAGVELKQDGEHVAARTIYAKYTEGAANLGFNFDLGGSNASIATTPTGDGYGVRSLRLKLSQPRLTLAGESDFAGLVSLSDVHLQVQNDFLGGAVAGLAFINNGVLELVPTSDRTLNGSINGYGALNVSASTQRASVLYTQKLTTTPVVIASGQQLSDFVGAGGTFGEVDMSLFPHVATPFFFQNDGQVATVQLQVGDGGHTKVVKVAFEQVGEDITARVVYSKHCSEVHNENQLGTDFDTTGADNTYTLIEVHLCVPRINLNAPNTYLGGTYIHNAEVQALRADALPAFGGVAVRGGGLILNAPNLSSISTVVGGLTSPITVTDGGTLTILNINNLGHSRPITLANSTLVCASGAANDSQNYANNLTLINSVAQGHALRVGYAGDAKATYRVRGSEPSRIEMGLYLVSGSLTLEVDDVTANAEPDLLMTGDFRNYAGKGPLTIYKRGGGTVSLAGNNNAYSGPLVIEAGQVQLDSTAALGSANAVHLKGGVLKPTAEENQIGALTLEGGVLQLENSLTAAGVTLVSDTQLELNAGSVAFADSSAEDWEPGQFLDIRGELLSQSVRFGTDAEGLSRAQLNQIKINGEAIYCRLNSRGYLTSTSGFLILLR